MMSWSPQAAVVGASECLLAKGVANLTAWHLTASWSLTVILSWKGPYVLQRCVSVRVAPELSAI